MFYSMIKTKKNTGTGFALQNGMRIAISHWLRRVSPLFDVSDKLYLIHIEDGCETRRERIVLVSRDPFGRAKEVSGLGTDVLICGAISHVQESALIFAGVQVVGFICGEFEAVLVAFLCGQLLDSRFLMPGRHRKRQRFRFRRGRGGR